MLSDDDLNRFRSQYIDIVMRPFTATSHQIVAWNDLVWQPNAATLAAFFDESAVPDDVAGPLLGLLSEIGIACAADVLHGVPLPLDYPGASMRRWQLRRELETLVETMSDAQLQSLIFHVHGMLS